MTRNVIKFGGSNLKCTSDVLRIVQVIRLYKAPVIVVSALYGLTNQLEQSIHDARKDSSIASKLQKELELRIREILELSISDPHAVRQAFKKFEILFNRLSIHLQRLCQNDAISPSFNAHILSFGERLSSLLLCEVLNYYAIDTLEALPEEIGLYTTGACGSAKVDFQRSAPLVRKALDKDKTYVVPGFYGISPNGDINLLGRGGSDYSAAAIARCIGAQHLDIWKDVDGFMTADPKLIPCSTKINRLSYAEAAELAYFGARILHPHTIEPLTIPQIPVRIFNIEQPAKFEPATYINGKSTRSEAVIKSLTFSKDFSILKLRSLSLGIHPGIVAKATTALDKAGINIKSIITSQIEINILLAKADIVRAEQLIKVELQDRIEDITSSQDIAVLATVGEGIKEEPGVAAKIFSAVARKRINIQMISFGSSQVSAYFIIRQEDTHKAIEEIHNEFFNPINN